MKIQAKAQQLLDFTRERAQGAQDWVELHNAVFWDRRKSDRAVSDRGGANRVCQDGRMPASLRGVQSASASSRQAIR